MLYMYIREICNRNTVYVINVIHNDCIIEEPVIL